MGTGIHKAQIVNIMVGYCLPNNFDIAPTLLWYAVFSVWLPWVPGLRPLLQPMTIVNSRARVHTMTLRPANTMTPRRDSTVTTANTTHNNRQQTDQSLRHKVCGDLSVIKYNIDRSLVKWWSRSKALDQRALGHVFIPGTLVITHHSSSLHLVRSYQQMCTKMAKDTFNSICH